MEVRRRLQTEKYNLNKEYSLNGPTLIRQDLTDPQPPPIDVAIAHEQWNRMLLGQPIHYRKIIKLRLQGRTNQEIAKILKIDEKTVRRFLKKLFFQKVA